MKIFIGFILIVSTMLGLGCAFNLGVAQLISPAQASLGNLASAISIWPLITIIAICGGSGGFVQALECENYHEIPLPFNDKKVDSGIFGHIFIGIFGAIVAISLMIGIFGLEIKYVLNANEELAESLKIFFYIAAISVIGGYSGLPIISLVSNAALKKVQHEVDSLKKEGRERQQNMDVMKQDSDDIKLENILLKADSYANSRYYAEAIELLEKDYLSVTKDNYKAYNLLAYCEKHNHNIQKAREYIEQSIKLQPSRVGYFNLACYLTLLDQSKSQVYTAISNSWEIAESVKEKKRLICCLKDDDDFTMIKNEEEFKNLITKFQDELNGGDNNEK